ncbi:hypothetical protein BH09SUM1_BH09SUM1_29600 [soil metagenome]
MAQEPIPEGPFRIEIKADPAEGAQDWQSAMAEFEEKEKPKRPVAAKPTAPPPPTRASERPKLTPDDVATRDDAPVSQARPMTRYEELCKTPSMKIEKADISVITDFSLLIGRVNEIGRDLLKLQKDAPEMFQERFYRTWHDNVKETSVIMLKELHALRNGRQQKKYDKKYVCSKCHSVFMAALGPDLLCDACKGEMAPRNGPY